MTHSLDERSGPFEVILLAFILIGRIVALVDNESPGVVDQLLGDRLIIIWSTLLLLGPVVAFTGIFWRGRRITALAIEQAGLVLVSGAALIYAAVLFFQDVKTDGTFTVTAFVAGYGIASIWRVFQIYRIQRAHIRQSNISNERAG